VFIVFCLSDGNSVELFIIAFATHLSSAECQQMSLDPSRETSSATYGKSVLFFFGDELKITMYICNIARDCWVFISWPGKYRLNKYTTLAVVKCNRTYRSRDDQRTICVIDAILKEANNRYVRNTVIT